MRINLCARFSRRLILGYDIWCQYGVHLLKRFKESGHLHWPDFLEELSGIVGAWHIYAHVRECFGRFSGRYVWGIGYIDMEILETLWSLLNLVTDATRNMSLANREETINFHMNDMNMKKNQRMSKWCCSLLSALSVWSVPPASAALSAESDASAHSVRTEGRCPSPSRRTRHKLSRHPSYLGPHS